MGESVQQRFIAELLRPLIARWLEVRGVPAFVGADQFIYWKQHCPTKCVSPDVYVMPGIDPNTLVGAWKLWEGGVVPSFAIELVSGDVTKDYVDAPRRYDELGVRELVLFDPGAENGEGRVRWQVLRRVARRGFVVVRRTNADRVRSQVLGCWLRAVGSGAQVRVRLGTTPRGDELVPTEAEAERVAKEKERAGRVRAEAQVGALRAELARLQGR